MMTKRPHRRSHCLGGPWTASCSQAECTDKRDAAAGSHESGATKVKFKNVVYKWDEEGSIIRPLRLYSSLCDILSFYIFLSVSLYILFGNTSF